MVNEDFSTYTEVDDYGNRVQIVDGNEKLHFDNFTRTRRPPVTGGQNTHLYKDFGAGYFTDWQLQFKYRVYHDSFSYTDLWLPIACFANDVHAFLSPRSYPLPHPEDSHLQGRAYLLRLKGEAGGHSISIIEWNDGVQVGSVNSGARANGPWGTPELRYDCTFSKSGKYLWLYTWRYDAATGISTKLPTLKLELDTDEAMRYFYGCISKGDGEGRPFDEAYSKAYKLDIYSTGSANLRCRFEVGQGWRDLKTKFEVRHSASANLKCNFIVQEIYDFSDSYGIAFYWWGSGLDIMVNLKLKTPTGDLIASFPDGPAAWRWVLLNWSRFTETGIDGSLPDKSKITHILWTVHTPGLRRVDRVSTYRCADLFCKFMLRTPDSSNLFNKFVVRNIDAAELFCKFAVNASRDLYCKFKVGQGSEDLFCKFNVGQDSQNLFAMFRPRGPWEDLTLFTEEDGVIDKIATRVTVTNFKRSGQTSKLYKDYGIDHFTDFIHQLEIRLTDTTSDAWWVPWGMANDVAATVLLTSGREYLIQAGSTEGNTPKIWLWERFDGGIIQPADSVVIELDKTYYLTLIKSGTSLQCLVYDAAAKRASDLIATLSLTVTDTAMRYFFASQTYGGFTPSPIVSGWAQYYSFI